MLKGSQITALALTLTSLIVGITTQIAYANQSIEHTVGAVEDSLDTVGDSNGTVLERRCIPKPPKKLCPIIHPKGNTPDSPRLGNSTSTTDIKVNQELEIVPAAKPVKSGSN